MTLYIGKGIAKSRGYINLDFDTFTISGNHYTFFRETGSGLEMIFHFYNIENHIDCFTVLRDIAYVITDSILTVFYQDGSMEDFHA